MPTKVILISQFPLPYSKIGSWTTLYKNYLENSHCIDVIVCPKTENCYPNVNYSFIKEQNFVKKVKNKITRQKYGEYIFALKKVIIPGEKYIIHFVDNFGLVAPIKEYLVKHEIITNFYLHFFYHGFQPYTKLVSSGKNIYENVDEVTLLTYDSYKAHLDEINVLPCRFSVLHNGIDTNKFKKVTIEEKVELKNKLDCEGKKIFIWCSQDRPKKGLDFILDVWKRVYSEDKNILLLVIGTLRKIDIDGVRFLGKIPNEELPKYYQMSDCYLFPTMCKEGFGLSLAEALHCGNYCIASSLGGVPEVLQYGKYGKLIQNPHFIEEWIKAINEFINSKEMDIMPIPSDVYTLDKWNFGMNEIIKKSKSSL